MRISSDFSLRSCNSYLDFSPHPVWTTAIQIALFALTFFTWITSGIQQRGNRLSLFSTLRNSPTPTPRLPRNRLFRCTTEEKNHITFVVKALGTWHLWKIYNNQDEISRRGNQIEHLHPFQFFATVASDSALHQPMQNLLKSSLIGPSFIEATGEGIERERAKTLQQTPLFAEEMGISTERITQLIEAREWKKFAQYLMTESICAPREGQFQV